MGSMCMPNSCMLNFILYFACQICIGDMSAMCFCDILWELKTNFFMCSLKEKHNSLALYILLRGLTLLIRCGNKPTAKPILRKVLAPTRWKHGDTALMCLSLSQLGYSWILKPSTLPQAYVNFLNHHGGKDLYKYRALRASFLSISQILILNT